MKVQQTQASPVASVELKGIQNHHVTSAFGIDSGEAVSLGTLCIGRRWQPFSTTLSFFLSRRDAFEGVEEEGSTSR
jgi:hypothetical protein